MFTVVSYGPNPEFTETDRFRDITRLIGHLYDTASKDYMMSVIRWAFSDSKDELRMENGSNCVEVWTKN